MHAPQHGSFPHPPDVYVERPNLCDTIDALFRRGEDAVVIEAEDGFGKTTLSAEFCRRNPALTAAAFLRHASRYAYYPEYVLEKLGAQLAVMAGQTPPSEFSPEGYRNLWYAASRRQRGKDIYVVVDGLDEIPFEDRHLAADVLQALPFGVTGFRFLFSARLTKNLALSSALRVQTLVLPHLTLEESGRMLGGLPLTHRDLRELHQACRGVPGRLVSVRQLLSAGETVETLLPKIHERAPHLFDLEWSRAAHDDISSLVIAVIANSRIALSAPDLARVVGLDLGKIERILSDAPFVSIGDAGHVEFPSEAHRRYSEERTKSYRRRAYDLIIDDLLGRPESSEALIRIPDYMEATGRNSDLLGYLTPDFFVRAAARVGSFGPLRRTTSIGFKAAVSERRDDAVVRMAVHGAILQEVERLQDKTAEIDARVALGEIDEARRIAEKAALVEDRFELLAVAAGSSVRNGKPLDGSLIDSIRRLYRLLPERCFPGRATEIAELLMPVAPDLGVELATRDVVNSDGGGRRGQDLALMRLSVVAGALGGKEDGFDSAKRLSAQIQDDKIREVADIFLTISRDYSATRVIEAVRHTGDTAFRMRLLRQWALVHARDSSAGPVIEFALELALRDASYVWNARDLREVLSPLPSVGERELAKRIIGMVDGLSGTLERVGPTVEYLRVLLTVAECELGLGEYSKASERLVGGYFTVSSMVDLPTRAECLARLRVFCLRVDQSGRLETEHGLRHLCSEEGEDTVRIILATTADHVVLLRGVMRALSDGAVKDALGIARRINVKWRRDEAFGAIALACVGRSTRTRSIASALEALSGIEAWKTRTASTIEVLQSVDELAIADGTQFDVLEELVAQVTLIPEAIERARASAWLLKILHVRAGTEPLTERLRSALHDAWSSLDSSWSRTDLAFEIASRLAGTDASLARFFLDQVESIRRVSGLEAREAGWLYMSAVQLALIAFSGLLPKQLDTARDIERIADLINELPSPSVRAQLWCDCSLRFYGAGREPEARRIVNERVYALLEQIGSRDKFGLASAVVRLAPALYVTNPADARDRLRSLPAEYRDAAYLDIAYYLLRKSPPGEPYEEMPKFRYQIDFSDALRLTELCEDIDADWTIYAVLSRAAWALVGTNRLTHQQRADLRRRFESLAAKKFPSASGIQHDGYLVVTKAMAARVGEVKDEVIWRQISDAAIAIPNLADRAYVVGVVADLLPTQRRPLRNDLVEHAARLTSQLPSAYERADHLRTLAESVSQFDLPRAKSLIRQSLDECRALSGDAWDAAQRRIVDAAYRVDGDWAKEVIEAFDDDPARSGRVHRMKTRLAELNTIRKVATPSADEDLAVPDSDLAEACWSALGSLNAGRVPSRPARALTKFLSRAYRMPMRESYPILAFVTKSMVHVYQKTDQAASLLRPVFEGTLLGGQLARRVADKYAFAESGAMFTDPATTGAGSSLIYREGERDRAMADFRSWIAGAASEEFVICDPYFTPEDVVVLMWIAESHPLARIRLLSGIDSNFKYAPDFVGAYRSAWSRQTVAAPPDVEITLAGGRTTRRAPIHDRWLLWQTGGIRMGTSFNGLGRTRLSEVSQLSEGEAIEIARELERYLGRGVREVSGERIEYHTFSL